MVRMIIRGVPDRTEHINYLKRVLPEAEWCMDKRYHLDIDNKIKSTLNFIDALMIAGNEPCLHLEEDVIITNNFVEKINKAISERPNELIQFFSMRKADIEIGSRYDNNFMMNQCFYLPSGYGLLIAQYYNTWHRKDEFPGGYDMMMNDWLKTRKEKYWIHVPSLVEHRVAQSVADKRRSKNRQSKTFIDPVL